MTGLPRVPTGRMRSMPIINRMTPEEAARINGELEALEHAMAQLGNQPAMEPDDIAGNGSAREAPSSPLLPDSALPPA